ncbi:MAG: lamin tail domain-containing protein [Gemmatimonadales bacterium]|nr:lamin tail domain-containing protein [Gemmatimonadales bacterium]
MKNLKWHPSPAKVSAFLIGAILAFGSPGFADIIVNELLADPATDWDGDGTVDFMGDEWIEILNNGSVAVDLAEYWLRDGLGDSPHLHLNGILNPGQVRLFHGSEAVAWQVENGVGATGFSLNNGGDTVDLLKNHYVDGNLMSLEVVQSVTYADHEADDDRSSGWSSESGGWALFDALNPYTGTLSPGGSGCAPTPGVLNFCIPEVGASKLYFGGLKASFR